MTQKEIKAALSKHIDDQKVINAAARTVFSLWKGGTMERLEAFVQLFNEIRGTKFKASPTLMKNFDHWLKVYEPHEMVQAVKNCDENFGEWMYNGFSPTKLLRTRNSVGECDYIGDLLNYTPKVKKVSSTPEIEIAK